MRSKKARLILVATAALALFAAGCITGENDTMEDAGFGDDEELPSEQDGRTNTDRRTAEEDVERDQVDGSGAEQNGRSRGIY